jgi:hypothetical protein
MVIPVGFIKGAIIGLTGALQGQMNLKKALANSLTNSSNPNSFEYKGNYYDINVYAQIRADIFKGLKEKDLRKRINKYEKEISKGKDVGINKGEIGALNVAISRLNLYNDDKYRVVDKAEVKEYINSVQSTEIEQKSALVKILPNYYNCSNIEQLTLGENFFDVKNRINQASLVDSVYAYKQISYEMKSYDESNRKGAKILKGLLLKRIENAMPHNNN